jgi:hypothetical protein
MDPANTYVIRHANTDDQRGLCELADLDSQRPLSGPVLIGEIDGALSAALSLTDGRLIADPFQRTAVLSQVLRMRADNLRVNRRTPTLPQRIRTALTPFRTAQTGQA